jgi:DNA polymerase III subunit alpha
MLSLVRIRQGKRGTFAACTLEDVTGSIESVVWSESLAKNRDLVQDDQIVVVRGSLKRDKESPILVITKMLSLDQAALEMAKELWLRIKLDTHRLSHIDALGEILRKTPGGCPVFLAVEDRLGKKAALRLSRAFGINPANYLHNELEDLLGIGSVKLR